jgi:hypothetical protein
LRQVAPLPEIEEDVPCLGAWSAKDLVAHLVGWDHANLEAARHTLEGQLPPFYAHQDRDWRTYNAMPVAEFRRESLAESIALARDYHLRLLEFLKTVSPELWSKDFGVRFRGYKVTIRRLLEAEIGDERVPRQQINRFLHSRS